MNNRLVHHGPNKEESEEPHQQETSHARAVLGIIFDISKSSAGGVQVATEFGVISTGSKRIYYIPSDRYVVKDTSAVVSDKLHKIRESVLDNTFKPDKTKRITMQEAHRQMTGYSPAIRHGCNCKLGCSGRCGCIRAKVSCSSKCKCNGNCMNPRNNSQ